jgi:hypothetical protein
LEGSLPTAKTTAPGFQRPKLGLALWGTEPVQVLAEHAALAERVGFESARIIDSQLLCREVYVTLAACLMRTPHDPLKSFPIGWPDLGIDQPRRPGCHDRLQYAKLTMYQPLKQAAG